MENIKSIKENHEGFEEYPGISTSRLPDFSQIIAQKLAPAIQPNLPGFDPHQLMIKKHKVETGEILPDTTTPEIKWPEKDMKALEDFCQKYGIIGFNCGRTSPIAALSMLKQKMGFGDTPLTERVPYGYQKAGTPNSHNANFPYNHPPDKRMVLNG